MLRTKVGYSTEKNSFASGVETAKSASVGMKPKLAMLYTSVLNEPKEVVKGARSILKNVPIIGCTSSGMIMTNDGIIKSDDGFSGMMVFDDKAMKVGVACHKAGANAREIGRKVARAAVENANENYSPNYYYMVASPKEEEDYLLGIEDVIGTVPCFGGSAADDTVEGKWKIYCNDEIFDDGVAVAFFYTDKEIENVYTGAYRETDKSAVITQVENNRCLQMLNGKNALDVYKKWIKAKDEALSGGNLLVTAITHPLGVKDPLGKITLVRHPMAGNEDGSMNIGNHLAVGTAAVLLEATVDELIDSTKNTLQELRSKMDTKPAGFFLVHCGGRALGIGDRIDEVHANLVAEAKGVPFLTIFTFGEYGFAANNNNGCGGLMLSFSGFGEE